MNKKTIKTLNISNPLILLIFVSTYLLFLSSCKDTPTIPDPINPAPPLPDIIWVDGENGSDVSGTGYESSPFKTIGSISARAGGKTIMVKPGTCSEPKPIRLAKDVTIIGSGSESTIVNAAWTDTNLHGDIFIFGATAVYFGTQVIEGLTVTQSGPMTSRSIGYSPSPGIINFNDCVFKDLREGIELGNSGLNLNLSNCIFDNLFNFDIKCRFKLGNITVTNCQSFDWRGNPRDLVCLECSGCPN